jgi:hypothetical protein
MTLILSGTNGLSDVDGDASTPAVRGTDANSGIFFGADTVGVSTGGSEKVSVGASAVVVNDGGADVDFRVEGDTEANLLFVDASTDRVGIGTSSPASKLHIQANANAISVDDGLSVRNSNSGSSAGARIALGNDVGTAPGLQLASSTNTTFGANALTVYQNLSAPVTFWTNNTERMRIDSSGNVGIGNSTPSSFDAFANNLVVGSGSGTEGITIYSGTTNAGALNFADGTVGDASYRGYVYYNHNGDYMAFYTAGANERARITSGGGITTPGSATDPFEFGVNRSGGLSFVVTNANTSSPFGEAIRFPGATPNNTINYFLFCDDSTNSKAIIYSDGSFQSRANSYGGISDVKLKQDIVDANSQWDDIKGLRIRKYRFKDEVAADPNYPSHLGVIAQEAEIVSPGLVFESPDFENVEVSVLDEEGNPVLDEEGNPQVTTERQATGTVTKGVKYSILYMKAVKALQEAMERIETLEASNTALEARIAALETGV